MSFTDILLTISITLSVALDVVTSSKGMQYINYLVRNKQTKSLHQFHRPQNVAFCG